MQGQYSEQMQGQAWGYGSGGGAGEMWRQARVEVPGRGAGACRGAGALTFPPWGLYNVVAVFLHEESLGECAEQLAAAGKAVSSPCAPSTPVMFWGES